MNSQIYVDSDDGDSDYSDYSEESQKTIQEEKG